MGIHRIGSGTTDGSGNYAAFDLVTRQLSKVGSAAVATTTYTPHNAQADKVGYDHYDEDFTHASSATIVLVMVPSGGVTPPADHNYRRATATKNTCLTAVAALLNGGGMQFRTGPQPTDPDDAAEGTLCATVTFGTPAFGTASAGVITAAAITSDTSADASGFVRHVRLITSAGDIHSDAIVATSGGDVTMAEPVIVAGGLVAVTLLRLEQ